MPTPSSPGTARDIPVELSSPRRRDWLLALLLIIATFLAYQPAWRGKPIWDDDGHLTKPELRSFTGLAHIWFKPGATQQYYPLVHTAFWVEDKLWGDSTTGYHLVNIFFHLAAAFLLLKTLKTLQIRAAWLVTAVFALHPVQVETVAWISELKNTLSATLYFGAAIACLRFDQTRSKPAYSAAFLFFVLALLSKTVVATLPAALLVVFWWKRGKLSWRLDVLPLLPFFAAGISAGLFTSWMERHLYGAQGNEYNFSIVDRCLIAGRAIWFYLGKLFWPVNLIFNYPRWNINATVWWQYLFPAVAVSMFVALWLVRHRWRGPLAAMLFFAGTLFPALGFVNVYPFRYSFVADHFQYLACIGPIVLAAEMATRSGGIKKPWLQWMLAGALLLTLGTLTWRQSRMYSNVETLWRTTIERNPDSWLAECDLGQYLAQLAKYGEAIPHFQRSLALYNDEWASHLDYGLMLAGIGDPRGARAQYLEAIRLKPGDYQAYVGLGKLFLADKQYAEAREEFEHAVRLDPSQAAPHFQLAITLEALGQMEAAVSEYETTLRINPDSITMLNDLAWIRAANANASLRNGAEAVRLAEHACELSHYEEPVLIGTLADAYAEAGRFKEAEDAAIKARDLARTQKLDQIAARNDELLQLYRAHQAYHESAP